MCRPTFHLSDCSYRINKSTKPAPSPTTSWTANIKLRTKSTLLVLNASSILSLLSASPTSIVSFDWLGLRFYCWRWCSISLIYLLTLTPSTYRLGPVYQNSVLFPVLWVEKIQRIAKRSLMKSFWRMCRLLRLLFRGVLMHSNACLMDLFCTVGCEEGR